MGASFNAFALIIVIGRVYFHQISAQENSPFLYEKFPGGFAWGVASAAYQVEGAADVDGEWEVI